MNPAEDDSFRQFILDQLQALGEVDDKVMFGGYGLYYRGDIFFAILFKERLYLKTGPESRKAYIKKGMRAFSPKPKQTLATYYEVPMEVVENREKLVEWAKEALSVARFLRLTGCIHYNDPPCRPPNSSAGITSRSWASASPCWEMSPRWRTPPRMLS